MELDTDQPTRPAGRILTRFRPRQYPAPFAVAVTHTMDALEYLGLSLEMIANLALYARQVIRMYQAPPVRRRVTEVIRAVAEHGLPSRRQVQRVGPHIEIPHAVVGAEHRKLVALLDLVQFAFQIKPFKTRCQRGSQQLKQQPVIYVPRIAALTTGHRKQAAKFAAGPETGTEKTPDLQLVQ